MNGRAMARACSGHTNEYRAMLNTALARRSLASFENAYAVAVQLREATGVDQFVVRTGNADQPFRVSRQSPQAPETMQVLVA